MTCPAPLTNGARIAAYCAIKFDDLCDGFDKDVASAPEKKRRSVIIGYWAYVRGTNVWRYGDDAFGMIPKTPDVNEHAFWCWYTALALDLCAMVRRFSVEFGITLPDEPVVIQG